MTRRLMFALAWILVAACEGKELQGNASASAAATHEEGRADASPDQQGGAPMLNFAATGLKPGLAFGTPKAAAIAVAAKSFGPPTAEDRVEECGAGAMDFVRFRGLSLAFQDGRFAGWSVDGPFPSVATPGGLAVGAPASALRGARVERSTLGPEFETGGVGGLLDEKEREIVALWAGLTCHFR